MKKLIYLLAAALAVAACSEGKEKPSPSENGDVSSTGLPKPAGLTATTTETTAEISWAAVSGADGYTYRLTQSGKLKDSGSVTTTGVTLESLTAGTTYLFQVYATAGTEKSSYSDALEVITQSKPGSVESAPSYADFLIPSNEESLGALAFPGAEGGGMYTTGGRGGKVYHVTNLNDSGSGSLRYGIREYKENGKLVRPLTIVFDVSGTIELQSQLKIESGDITIAGQTAPGDGICLKNYTTYVGADNVIIRFLRFRLGDEGPNAGDSEDCIWGRYQNNVIIDHCSMSWSIDETASFYANANFTMQWCIVAESLQSTVHSKGSHGYGGIWGGKNASFHHNLLAHHQNRTPRFDHQYLYDGNGKSTDTYRGNVDYRNCINYNWGSSNACYGGEGGHFNLVNNYYKKGPNSNNKKYFVEADGGYSTKIKDENDKEVTKYFDYDWAYLYLSGNYNHDYPDVDASYPDGIYWKKAYTDYNKSYEGHVSSSAFPIKGKDGKDAYTTTHTAADALDAVCTWAGASLKRDAVDERICKDVKSKTGRLLDNMADVKSAYGTTWPTYHGETRSELPSWVGDPNAYTLDPKKRYTNLEMYLHYLVRDVVEGQNKKGNYSKL